MQRFVLIICMLAASSAVEAQWLRQAVDTKAAFRGLSVVSDKVVWASGTGGTVIRTIDGGKKWDVIQVPDAGKLDFRDIEAFDANTAYILSIGSGDSSRIYKTQDGGKTWKLQFKNTNEKAFFDAVACWDRSNCIAMSDPVGSRFVLIETKNGGASWTPVDTSKMPATSDGEAAFAASGTCLITHGKNDAFIISGGTDARVFHSTDRGKTWSVANSPITKGTSGSGIFSIAMADQKNGIMVGGNYEKPTEAKAALALTSDSGKTWKPGSGLSGYRSSVTYVDKNTLVAVGTNGSDISLDGGRTWLRIDGENNNSVQARGKNSVWAVGPKGYVAKLDWREFFAINGYKSCRKNTICDAHVDVRDIRLSHLNINSSCEQTDSQCSDKRQVQVSVIAEDVPNNWYEYVVSEGQIVGMGPNVIWDLTGAKPGTYAITAGVNMPALPDMFQVVGRTATRHVVVK